MLSEYSWYPGLDRLHQCKHGSDGLNATTDAFGNVVALTSSTGVHRTYEYTVHGASTGGVDSYSFNGRDRARFKGALFFPEVGLCYMRNRWYELHWGRFLSEDPAGTGASNRFLFAADDPINASDPTGMIVEYYSCQIDRYCPEAAHPLAKDCPFCNDLRGSAADRSWLMSQNSTIAYDRRRDGPLPRDWFPHTLMASNAVLGGAP